LTETSSPSGSDAERSLIADRIPEIRKEIGLLYQQVQLGVANYLVRDVVNPSGVRMHITIDNTFPDNPIVNALVWYEDEAKEAPPEEEPVEVPEFVETFGRGFLLHFVDGSKAFLRFSGNDFEVAVPDPKIPLITASSIRSLAEEFPGLAEGALPQAGALDWKSESGNRILTWSSRFKNSGRYWGRPSGNVIYMDGGVLAQTPSAFGDIIGCAVTPEGKLGVITYEFSGHEVRYLEAPFRPPAIRGQSPNTTDFNVIDSAHIWIESEAFLRPIAAGGMHFSSDGAEAVGRFSFINVDDRAWPAPWLEVRYEVGGTFRIDSKATYANKVHESVTGHNTYSAPLAEVQVGYYPSDGGRPEVVIYDTARESINISYEFDSRDTPGSAVSAFSLWDDSSQGITGVLSDFLDAHVFATDYKGNEETKAECAFSPFDIQRYRTYTGSGSEGPGYTPWSDELDDMYVLSSGSASGSRSDSVDVGGSIIEFPWDDLTVVGSTESESISGSYFASHESNVYDYVNAPAMSNGHYFTSATGTITMNADRSRQNNTIACLDLRYELLAMANLEVTDVKTGVHDQFMFPSSFFPPVYNETTTPTVEAIMYSGGSETIETTVQLEVPDDYEYGAEMWAYANDSALWDPYYAIDTRWDQATHFNFYPKNEESDGSPNVELFKAEHSSVVDDVYFAALNSEQFILIAKHKINGGGTFNGKATFDHPLKEAAPPLFNKIGPDAKFGNEVKPDLEELDIIGISVV